VQTLLKENGSTASALPVEMQSFLKRKTQAWRDTKNSLPKSNNKAVIQDANHTLQRLGDEVSTYLTLMLRH
jgi:hypothetical protein